MGRRSAVAGNPVVSSSGVLEVKTGPHILVRIAWYFLVGWWRTGMAMAIAWFAAVVIVGLPLAFWLVNRIPHLFSLHRGYA